MREYLLFRLYGPLASWGDVAVGDYRPTQAAVSKSGMVGLIAAALGIRRDDAEQQNQMACGYAFACRQEKAGVTLRDFHTAQVPSARKGIHHHTRRDQLAWAPDAINTIISQRDYRQDYACTVAVWARESAPYSLSDIAQALTAPQFTLYLGRKSCPLAWPLSPQVVTTKTLACAFEKVPFWAQGYTHYLAQDQAARGVMKNALDEMDTDPESATYFWESDALEPDESGLQAQQAHTRRDVPRSRRRWQFDERLEMMGAWPGEDR